VEQFMRNLAVDTGYEKIYLDKTLQPNMFQNEVTPLTGVLNVQSAIRNLLHTAARNESDEDHTIRIYQIMMDSYLMSVLEEVCRENPKVPVTHIFAADNSRSVLEERTLYNIELLQHVGPMVMKHLNYTARYFYLSVGSVDQGAGFMANVILTRRHVLLFSTDHEYGMVLRNGTLVLQHQKMFHDCEKRSVDFAIPVSIGDDPMHYMTYWKEALATSKSKMPGYYFDAGITLEQVLTVADTVEHPDGYLRDDVSDRDQYQDSYRQYLAEYQKLRRESDAEFYDLYTKQAIEALVYEGKPNKAHPKDAKPLSMQERMDLLHLWLDFVVRNNLPMLDMPDSPHYAPFNIMSTPQRLFIIVPAANGRFYMSDIREPSLIQLFYNSIEFFVKNYSWTMEDTVRFIRSKIKELEAAQSEGNIQPNDNV